MCVPFACTAFVQNIFLSEKCLVLFMNCTGDEHRIACGSWCRLSIIAVGF